MARKKPSVQTLLKTDRALAEMVRTYAEMPPEARNALLQCSHYIKRITPEIEAKIEEKYRKKYADLRKEVERLKAEDDHD